MAGADGGRVAELGEDSGRTRASSGSACGVFHDVSESNLCYVLLVLIVLHLTGTKHFLWDGDGGVSSTTQRLDRNIFGGTAG
jgi:hypothetical protein